MNREWKEERIESRSLIQFLGEKKKFLEISGGVKQDKWDNYTFSIIGKDPDNNLTMLRKDNLKLIRLARGEEEPLYEMYDMNDEIYETRNIYDDTKYKKEKDEMKNLLDNWWREQKRKYPEEVECYNSASCATRSNSC